MATLICEAHVKKYALDVAKQRHHKFNRVSKKFLNELNAKVRNMVHRAVTSHRSVGQTITDI